MKIIILFSGGVDSLLCYHLAKEAGHNITLLHMVYEHPARVEELRAVQRLAQGAYKVTQDLNLWSSELNNFQYQETGAPGPRVIVARNQVFLSHGVNAAAFFGAKEVWFGANADDFEHYLDCRPDFITAFNALGFMWGVTVKAPLIDMTKPEIMTALRRRLKSDTSSRLEHAWSCYTPRSGRPCGSCDSCKSDDRC